MERYDTLDRTQGGSPARAPSHPLESYRPERGLPFRRPCTRSKVREWKAEPESP